MEWLGHFEFGEALRPIDFGGWMDEWMDEGAALDPLDEAFWLTYWSSAYEAVIAAAGPNVHFFDYDCACAEPETMLETLALALDVEDPSELRAQAARFRRPTQYNSNSRPRGTTLSARAQRVFDAMRSRSI